MIEVAHRQHGSPSFRPTTSSSSPSSSSSSSRSAPDLAPLPIRHLKAPPSPLVNNFTSSSYSVEENAVGEETTKSISKQALDSPRSAKATSPRNRIGLSGISQNTSKTKAGLSLAMANADQPQQTLVRRIRKGQKWEDFQPPISSDIPCLQSIDSPFQLQEYLSLLIRLDPHNVQKIVALPDPSQEPTKTFTEVNNAEKGKARDCESAPFGSMEDEISPVDTDVWVYEQLRRLVLDFSTPWLTMLQKDCDKKKNPKTCEAMNADDWMYLCASHGEEKQCCAIDYIIHTLDGTTALLNSQRHFPSRTFIPTTSLRHFGSVTRRLSRIFVHAFEHHRDVFEVCEAETSLYARFLALVQAYDLMSVESLPQLGEITTRKRQGNSQADDFLSSDKEEKGMSEEVSLEDDERSRRKKKGQLFEAGVVSSQEEEEEDPEDEGNLLDEHLVEENASDNHTRLQRSDSSSSRVTAIHVSPIKETQSSQEPTQNIDLSSPREKAEQAEVPQDVKDDEEEE